jgi:hypothetical protein
MPIQQILAKLVKLAVPHVLQVRSVVLAKTVSNQAEQHAYQDASMDFIWPMKHAKHAPLTVNNA